MGKTYYIKKYHKGNYRIIRGDIASLTKYFGYTLECGQSWNPKINRNPKTLKSLISNINKSYHETQGSCFDQDSVSEATEYEYENASLLGYRV